MANNIGYKASIDVDWVRFKEQSGVIISDSGKTLETTNVIPSNLKLIVSENKGKTTRTATITFTQEGGETKTVTLTQNANKAGTYQDGKPYLDKNKSGVIINTSETTELGTSGGTINFTDTYEKNYSVKMYEMDADGNIIKKYVEDYPSLNSEENVTSACTWTVSPAINGSKINNGKLFIGENKSNGSPIFSVNAIYKDLSLPDNTFTSNTLTVMQEASSVDWTYTVKTNNSGTTVYFLSGGSEVYHEVAELKNDAYYSTYSTSGIESPNISAYIVKENVYTTPVITLYEKGTETKLKDYKWNASASGDSMELDAVYEVSKTTYKVDNDSSNPITLVDGETFEINSNPDKTESIKKRANDTKSKSQWLKVSREGDGAEDFTFGITAEATDTNRDDGYINFKYIDDEMPSAETRFNVSQIL